MTKLCFLEDKKKSWQPVYGQFGNIAKDDSEHQCGENRLNDLPQRTHDGLLVIGWQNRARQRAQSGHGSATTRPGADSTNCAEGAG